MFGLLVLSLFLIFFMSFSCWWDEEGLKPCAPVGIWTKKKQWRAFDGSSLGRDLLALVKLVLKIAASETSIYSRTTSTTTISGLVSSIV